MIKPFILTPINSDSIDGQQLGFSAVSLMIDNPTGQWYRVSEPNGYITIPAYSVGMIVALPVGTQVATIKPFTPAGSTSNPKSGQQANFVYSDTPMMNQSGTLYALDATIQNAEFVVSGTVDANITNASIPVTGTVDANIQNASLAVTGDVNATITNAQVDTNIINTTASPANVTGDVTINNDSITVQGDVTATLPAGTTVDANITNASISVDANITNASLPVSGDINATIQNASIDTNILNTSLDTNAGSLSGDDDISGSPFSVAAGSSAGTLGPWDTSNWGGITLTAIAPVSEAYDTNGDATKLTIETSQDDSTWYTYQYFVLSSGSTANVTLPRAGKYFRISYSATLLGFTVFARFVRTEVLSESLIVPYVPGVKADYSVLVASDSWQFQAGLLSNSTEILYLLVTSPGPSSPSDNVIGFALGDENTLSPELVIAYSEINGGDNRIELGPFLPGQGIATRGYTTPALFTSQQANMSYTIWYR